MEKNTSRIAKEKDAIITAIIVSLIFGLPHILMGLMNGYLYNPLPIENVDLNSIDESSYISKSRKVIDGNYFPLNAHIEGKGDVSNNVELFPDLLVGILAKLFGMDLKGVAILADFIFPPAIFLIYFFMAHKIFGIGRKLSMASSLLVVFFAHDISLKELIVNTATLDFRYFINYYAGIAPLELGRAIHPEITLVPMLLSIVFLYMSFTKNSFVYPALAGLSAGALAYSYFYYFTFFWTLFFVFVFLLFFYGRKKMVLPKAILIGIVGILLAIPYIIRIKNFNSLPYIKDILLRIGVQFGNNVNILAILLSISAILLLSLIRFKQREAKFFLAAIAISTALILNIQVAIGYTVQDWHWWTRILNPLYIFLFALVAQNIYGRFIKNIMDHIIFSKIIAKGIFYLFIIGFVALASYIQTSFALTSYESYKFSDEELELYSWLNKNTEKGSTVLSISLVQNSKIPVFTHNNIYLPNGLLNSLPTDEIIDRLLSSYNVSGVFREVLLNKLNMPNNAFIDNYYTALLKENKKIESMGFEDYYFNLYLFHFQFKFSRNRGYSNPDNQTLEGYYFPLKFRDFAIKQLDSGNYMTFDYDYILVDEYTEQVADVKKIESTHKKVFSNKKFLVYLK